MRLANLIFLFIKKITISRKLEIIGVIIMLIILSNSELLGLILVKETISSIVNKTESNYQFLNFLYNVFPSETSSVEKNAVLLIIITINTLFFRIFSAWWSLRIVAKTNNDIATVAYKNIIYQPYKYHLKRNSSEVVSLLTFDALRGGDAIGNILQISTSILVSFGIILGLLIVNWKLSILSFLIVFSFYTLFNILVKRKIKTNGKFISDASNIQTRLISESIGNIRNILLDSNQNFYSKIFKKLNRQIRVRSSDVVFMTIIPRYLIESIGIIALSIFLYFLSKNAANIENTFSYIGVIAYGSQKLLPSINNIYSSYSDLYYAQESLEKTLKALYINEKQENEQNINIKESEKLNFEKIEFKNIFFKFDKDHDQILEDLNFSIKRGSKIGIIGPTGSGKSTLIDLIMGLIKPTKGEILINDKDLFNGSDNEFLYKWRSIISHVPQSIFISDCSIEENIALGINQKLIKQNLLIDASKISELYDFIMNAKYKFKMNVGEKGARLSGGQRQRLGIARAIYKMPKVLILDEATSALDNYTEKKIIKNINNLSNDITLIMIAHRTSTLKYCDEIYEIQNKKLILKGTPKNALEL